MMWMSKMFMLEVHVIFAAENGNINMTTTTPIQKTAIVKSINTFGRMADFKTGAKFWLKIFHIPLNTSTMAFSGDILSVNEVENWPECPHKNHR